MQVHFRQWIYEADALQYELAGPGNYYSNKNYIINENENKKLVGVTWTLDSGKLIFSATSSLMKISGYRVFEKSDSRISSWARVKVVLSRLCFRPGCPEKL